MQRYNPKEIEPKWQKIWEEAGTYTADLKSDKPKYIAMSMFNYPSGAGIHIGHAMNYTISDVKARFKRQQGYESYHPVGWDAFGLPAENYALKTGVSPQESMATIIPDYHKQYKAMGWSNDWEKEIATHLPEYYKWTQWIFTQMFKQGLAYQDSRMQWWCPIDKTVLANEQVIDGKCWRHDGPDDPPAEKREVKQWFFKITEYADELLDAIDSLDWSESVKLAQKNWIGKSVGAEIDFGLDFGDPKVNEQLGPDNKRPHVTVFTTRPDTLFGATFLILAPEHPWVTATLGHGAVLKNNDEVASYIEKSKRKSDLERQENKDKTGVEIKGVTAVNPINGDRIPIWIADYVLAGYGTGAIMAVPAHDERDHDFAKKFELPIVPVVAPAFFQEELDAVQSVERPTAVAITHDPATNTYAVLDWSKSGHRSGLDWPGGGMDEGETVEQAAIREFTEETGFSDVTVIDELPANVILYYAADGKVKRAVKRLVTLRLNSREHIGSQGKDEYEKGAYNVRWLTREELLEGDMVPTNAAIRDFVFNGTIHVGEGVLINSDAYNNFSTSEAREKIVADLAQKGAAKERTNYKMRDWSVSRQRYWGAPIPIIHCSKCGPQLVPGEQLPVILPEVDDFAPTGDGRSALARAKDWLEVACPKCDGSAERETDTLDTYVDSSFYMYRYLDPHNQQAIFDSDIAKKWEPIDFYNGADHATAHLLYARFMARFFTKLGLIDKPEPFKQFLFNGKVTASDGTMFSKSKGNGVDPLEIINQGYGADALRTYLMFASPLELWTKWDAQGVPGAYRFLNRLWNLVGEYIGTSPAELTEKQQQSIRRVTHQAVKKMTEDIQANHYNTAIAAAMACLNELYKFKTNVFGKHEAWQQALENVVACVAPFAPHIADELWHQLGHSTSVHSDSWPSYDEKYLERETVTIVVQVNGRVRAQLEMPFDADEAMVRTAAEANDKVQVHIAGKEIIKTIYVPDKILNLVVG